MQLLVRSGPVPDSMPEQGTGQNLSWTIIMTNSYSVSSICQACVAQYLYQHMLCYAYSLSYNWLFATPWTVACQAPLSMGILQARILEWVAMPYARGSFQPRDRTQVSCIAGGFFTVWATREAQEYLDWVTYSLLQATSQPRNWIEVSCIAGRFLFLSLPAELPGNLPYLHIYS